MAELQEGDEPFSPGFAAATDYVRSWRSSQRLPLLRADIQAAVDSIASFSAPFKQVSSHCGIVLPHARNPLIATAL